MCCNKKIHYKRLMKEIINGFYGTTQRETEQKKSTKTLHSCLQSSWNFTVFVIAALLLKVFVSVKYFPCFWLGLLCVHLLQRGKRQIGGFHRKSYLIHPNIIRSSIHEILQVSNHPPHNRVPCHRKMTATDNDNEHNSALNCILIKPMRILMPLPYSDFTCWCQFNY